MLSTTPTLLTRKYFILFLFGFLAALVLNGVTLKDGHNWGEDFSQYILNAQNLLQGKSYNAGIMIESPFSYPPGFPILLMPFLQLFGVNFLILKSLNILFWFAGVACWYVLLKKRLGEEWAVLGGLLFVFSSYFFTLKQNVLSDVPFFFCASACLLVFSKLEERANTKDSGKLFALFLFLMVYAFLIRLIGLSLFCAAVYYLFFIEKNRQAAGWVILFLGGSIGLDVLIRGVNPGFFNVVFFDPLNFLNTILKNMSLALQSLLWVVLPGQTVLSEIIFKAAAPVLVWAAPVIYLAGVVFFVKKTFQKRLNFLDCFTFFYFLIFIFWSGFGDSVSSAGRMALILIGPAVILLVEALRFLAGQGKGGSLSVNFLSKGLAVVFGFILSINIFNMAVLFRFDDDVLLKKENQELFTWVKENVAPQERYIFWIPRVMALMTGRVGTAPWTRNPGTQKDIFARIKQHGITYVILIKSVDGHLIALLTSSPQRAVLVWENSNYFIFKVKAM